MTQAEAVVDIDSSSKLLEKLGKVFNDVETNKDAFSKFGAACAEMKAHIQNLENSLRKRSEELVEREKAFEEKASSTRRLINEREAEVAGKERASLDHIQELRDTAVDAIAEARKKFKLAITEPDIQASPSRNGDPKSPNDRSGGFVESTSARMKLHPKMKQVCEQMDSKGLLKLLSENKKQSAYLCAQIPIALKNADDVARLVIDSLGVIDLADGNQKDAAAFDALRRACLVLMEELASFFNGEKPPSSETLEKAKSVANEWNSKLEAADGSSLEAQVLLQLLATFNIAREFGEDELCKLVLAASGRRRAAELCRPLRLDHRIPGIIEELISRGRHIDAIHLAFAFKLTGSFRPVALLREYLSRSRSPERSTDDSPSGSQDADEQELSTLRSVIKCIEEYCLQSEFSLAPLQRRVSELKRAKADNGYSGQRRFRHRKLRSGGGGGGSGDGYYPRLHASAELRGGGRYSPRFAGGDHRSGGRYSPRFATADRGRPLGFDEDGFRGDSLERYPYSAPPPPYALQAAPGHAPYEPTSYVPSPVSYVPERSFPGQDYFPEEMGHTSSYGPSSFAGQGRSGPHHSRPPPYM
ncbi:FRIGIDA-like protein [Wolffia australiana]